MSSQRLLAPIKAVAVFSVLSFLPAVINFFLLPVYLKYLSPEAYGALAILLVFGGLYGIVANLQINVAAGVDYFEYQKDKKRLKKYISSIFTVSILLSVITYLLFVGVGDILFEYVLKSDTINFYPYGLIALSSTFFTQLSSVYFVFLKNEYKIKEFFLYSFSSIVLNVVFQYYFIVVLHWGIMGSIFGGLLSKVLVALVLISLQRGLIDFKPDYSLIKRSLRFSIPFIPIVLMNWLLTKSDRFFIERYMDLSSVGKYALLMNILLLANQGFTVVWSGFTPRLLEYFNKPNDLESNVVVKRIVEWHIKIGLIVLSATILLGSNLSLITSNQKYLSIGQLFSLGALAFLPKMLISVPHLQLMYLKQSKIISWISFASFTILIIGFLLFIPLFGLRGGLYALSISNLTSLFLLYWIAVTRFKVPQIMRGNFRYVVVSLFLGLIIYYLSSYLELNLEVYGFFQFLSIFIYICSVSLKDIKVLTSIIK